MKTINTVNVFLLLTNIIMLATGQVFFKLGLEKIGGVSLNNAWRAILNLHIIAGLSLYVIATLIWFVVLSRVPLSVAYPVQSLAYVLGIIAALLFFHESVSIVKWLGMAVIMVGVVIITLD